MDVGRRECQGCAGRQRKAERRFRVQPHQRLPAAGKRLQTIDERSKRVDRYTAQPSTGRRRGLTGTPPTIDR